MFRSKKRGVFKFVVSEVVVVGEEVLVIVEGVLKGRRICGGVF